MNPVLIIARLVVPLIILKYPLIGGAIAIYLDAVDWHTRYLFDLEPVGNYQKVDKFLDLYYLSLLAIIARSFTDKLMKNIILGLFFYRALGVILFELTGIRLLLFIFPNIFENLFFFYYLLIKIASYTPRISPIMLLSLIVVVSIPKLIQEYAMHIIQKPLFLHVEGISLHLEGITLQFFFLFSMAVVFGLLYRSKKSQR